MKRGFTLVELMIVLAIVAVVLMIIFSQLGNGCAVVGGGGRLKAGAESRATQWAQEMGMSVQGVSCMTLDSDGDGYVSCTLNSGGVLTSIECPFAISMQGLVSATCRVQKAQLGIFGR